MSKFDLDTAKAINDALKVKLAELSAEFGIDITSEKVRFGEKISISVIGRKKLDSKEINNGFDICVEHRKFFENAKHTDIECKVGKTITVQKMKCVILGKSSNRSNAAIIIQDLESKEIYRMSSTQFKTMKVS